MHPIYIRLTWCYIGAIGVTKLRKDFAGFVAGLVRTWKHLALFEMDLRRITRIMRSFLPHQVRAWEYVRTRDRIALFMKMRLGKTIVTIRWAKHRLPADANILIIAPLSVLPGWLDELRLEGEAGTILSGTSRQKMRALQNCETRWVLVNPEGFRVPKRKRGQSRPAPSEISMALTNIAWDCVILDESTFITNPQSAITQFIRKEFKDVQCKAILAGEPAPESPLDYFEQLAFVHGELLGCRTYYHFRHKFFHRPGWDWVPRHRDFKKRLREEVRRLAFVLSANEAGVKFNRVYQKRYVHLDHDKALAYRKVRKDFATAVDETKWSVVTVGWLTRMAGGCAPSEIGGEPWSTHKLDELDYLVRERFADEQLVVWFRYTDEIRHCYDRLSRASVRLRCITGKTPLALRHAYAKGFNAGRIRVLLVQAKCVRMGVDLRGANTAIFYSNWWDWLTRAQAEARIEHPTKIGSTLLYIDLITAGTYDEDVVDTLKDKKVDSRYFLQRVMVKHAARNRSRRQDDGVRASRQAHQDL